MKKPITAITVLIAMLTILFYTSTAFAEKVIIGTWNLKHFKDGQSRGSPETQVVINHETKAVIVILPKLSKT